MRLLKNCPPGVNGATWLIEHSLAQVRICFFINYPIMQINFSQILPVLFCKDVNFRRGLQDP